METSYCLVSLRKKSKMFFGVIANSFLFLMIAFNALYLGV